MASIKSKFSRVLSLGRKQKHPPMPNGNAHGIHEGPEDDDDRSMSSSDVSSNVPAPMLDPSTNVNPLGPPEADAEGTPRARTPAGQKKKKATSADVSKHTFFIENSQTRLKLFARNEVCGVDLIGIEANGTNLTFWVRKATNAAMDRGV